LANQGPRRVLQRLDRLAVLALAGGQRHAVRLAADELQHGHMIILRLAQQDVVIVETRHRRLRLPILGCVNEVGRCRVHGHERLARRVALLLQLDTLVTQVTHPRFHDLQPITQ